MTKCHCCSKPRQILKELPNDVVEFQNEINLNSLFTITGGKYKGRSAVLRRFTKCKVEVQLIDEDNRVVLLSKNSIFGRGKSDIGNEDLLFCGCKEKKAHDQSNIMLLDGDSVAIDRGKYRNMKGSVTSITPKMVYVLLSDGRTVRIMKTSCNKVT